VVEGGGNAQSLSSEGSTSRTPFGSPTSQSGEGTVWRRVRRGVLEGRWDAAPKSGRPPAPFPAAFVSIFAAFCKASKGERS